MAQHLASVILPHDHAVDAIQLWQHLDQFLWHYRDLWQFHTLASTPTWWQHELGTWLRQQAPDPQHLGDWLPQWPSAHMDYQAAWQSGALAAWQASPSMAQSARDCGMDLTWPVPAWPEVAIAPDPLPFWLSQDIGGRKWQQILQFVAQLPPLPERVIEWCAGKGHLGMALAAMANQPDSGHATAATGQGARMTAVKPVVAPTSTQVLSVEWQASLCQQGQARAAQYQLSQQFVTVDVLAESLPASLVSQPTTPRLLALHACGDLHRRALQLARQQQWPATIVPCCYHLQAGSAYQPLSQQAQQTRLQLSRADLKLAVQGQHTGGQRILRLRQREVWWRLAYQLWRSHELGDATYQPLNSIPKQWLSGEFSAFVEYAAAQQGLRNVELSSRDAEHYLQLSWPRYIDVQQLERVKHWFQPVLELWLILDRAFYMAEDPSVSQVQVLAFCQAALTPRRYMLQSLKSPLNHSATE